MIKLFINFTVIQNSIYNKISYIDMEQLTEIERLSFSHMYDSVALLNSGGNPRPDHVALFLNLSTKAVSCLLLNIKTRSTQPEHYSVLYAFKLTT